MARHYISILIVPSKLPQALYRLRQLFICRKTLARRVVHKKGKADDVGIKTHFGKIKARPDNRARIPKGGHSMTNDNKSLARTTWNCKYHIVYAPKYRRKVSYKEKRVAVGKILRRLFEWKGVKIVEAEVCQSMCICFWRYGRSCRCRASWGI